MSDLMEVYIGGTIIVLVYGSGLAWYFHDQGYDVARTTARIVICCWAWPVMVVGLVLWAVAALFSLAITGDPNRWKRVLSGDR